MWNEGERFGEKKRMTGQELQQQQQQCGVEERTGKGAECTNAFVGSVGSIPAACYSATAASDT